MSTLLTSGAHETAAVASFETAWNAAREVPGWLEENEARHLYQSALQVPLDHCIVDIGTFQGRCCVLLAHTGRQILTIDSLTVGHDPVNRVTITEADVPALEQRLRPFSNVTWLRLPVQNCPLPDRPIGMLHVDGDHSYPNPLRDFEHFRSALSPDAFVAFHDYCTFPGVNQSIAELRTTNAIQEGRAAESMYIARLARTVGPQASVVTGFHLVALCHRFGRRGRAFAASLANQAHNPYPIHLTVFYSEPIDATHVLQGCLQGPVPPTLTLKHTPPQSIMQCAIHFASAEISTECSHIVYLDSDLWFPPDFWSSYGDAVGGETAGYWSSFVRDVPFHASEELLADWQNLDESRLRRHAGGTRHDSYQGRVGHFQCVPAGLTRYPLDWIQAVNRADETFARQAIELSQDRRPERRLSERAAYHFDHPMCWTGSSELL